jgi:hypothetical protein
LTIDEIDLINNVYRSTKSDLSTKENIIKLYINMIKNICGDLPIIISSQQRINKIKTRVYEINKELLVDLLTLTKLKNPYLKNYNKEIVKKLTNIEPDIEPPIKCETPEEFIEIEEMYNTYLFNKRGKPK